MAKAPKKTPTGRRTITVKTVRFDIDIDADGYGFATATAGPKYTGTFSDTKAMQRLKAHRLAAVEALMLKVPHARSIAVEWKAK